MRVSTAKCREEGEEGARSRSRRRECLTPEGGGADFLKSKASDYSSARVGFVGRALARIAAEEFGGEERDGEFVVARDGEASARAAARGSADDVRERAVGLHEVEVRGREVRERVAEVSHERDALEEDFGQYHGGADVEVDAAAVQTPDQLREQTEVRVGRRAERRAVHARVEVRDVRADGDVRGEGHTRLVRRAEQRQLRVLRVRRDERASQRFAHAYVVARRLSRRAVQKFPRLVGRAERARAERRVNVLGRRADERNLCVVHEHRAVGRDTRDESAPHQIYDERRESDLDDVPADAPDDGLAQLSRPTHARSDFTQRPHGENVWQRRKKLFKRRALAERPREIFGRDLARPRRQRVRVHAFEPERPYVVVDGHLSITFRL
jgi:hypothetical protein